MRKKFIVTAIIIRNKHLFDYLKIYVSIIFLKEKFFLFIRKFVQNNENNPEKYFYLEESPNKTRNWVFL